MTISEFIAMVTASPVQKCFYHFTDTRNLPSIRTSGLLSAAELKRRNIAIPAPGGNDWSKEADLHAGMDQYVHLCFRSSHPMEFKAKKEGRIQESLFLRIDPTVLRASGVMVTDGVSNKAGGVSISTPEQILHRLDLEVLYKRTEWKDPAIQERLKVASKYEILVPKHVDVTYFQN